MRQTVVFDFDGVIHSYTSGWQGETCIPDPPVDGIQEAIHSIHEAGYEVVIVSTRCSTLRGRMAIESWLDMYQMTQDVDRVCKEKPPAIVYIDDRAIYFDGHPESLLGKIKAFEPWNKKAPTIDLESLRPKGEWEAYPSDQYRRCSHCKTEWEKEKIPRIANYCPYCGAKMKGAGD